MRNPSKILSATEAKELDLQQQIVAAQKAEAIAQKAHVKAQKVTDKLLAKQAKIEEKRLSKKPTEDSGMPEGTYGNGF